MIKRLFLLAALTGVWSVSAQNGTLHLRLVDRVTREPVVGAVAELRSQADTARTPFYAASDIDGVALLQRVPTGAWRLRVTSLGYEALERELRTSGGKTDLGTLEMSPGAEAIESVVLEVPALRSSIRGDTLSYRASAYKVTFGADAGALIGKMPGLEVADGVIEAQGRTVQRVFVDGREFFGNDVMSAVRNIPADMVESIDVYNSQGDQSEFTGVDIGDGYTAINIVTQHDKRRGAFGRLFAGYGIPDKYIGGGNVNIFDRARRLSVIALVNNVNMQNFSSEDILGTTEQGQANARSGSGNFMVRPLDGVSTVQAVGANYSDEWGEKAKITASYFFNRAGNRNESLTDRQTFTSSEKLVLYAGATDARIENVNHRFNSRFDYKFNNRHSLMMRTAFSVQDYLLDNETFSRTDNKFADDDIRFVNRRRNFAHNDNFGYNVSNNLIYRYRLPGSKLRSLFDRYKFVLVVILAGVVLLLLPSFGGEKRGGGAVESSQESGSDPFQVEELERKLEQALAQIDGVGEVRVVLTLQSGPRRILAQDSQSTVDEGRTEAEVTNVVISAGSVVEVSVTVQLLSPQFLGALVVCSGGV